MLNGKLYLLKSYRATERSRRITEHDYRIGHVGLVTYQMNGNDDGKRLIESFTAKDYTTDVLELVETIMTWFDEDRNGKAFIDKFHEIKNKHVSQSRESYKIVQLKKLINEVPDLPSYYDYGKIQEIIHHIKSL